jgi:tRNA threonylcarbamoyladenosine biosynthesis protein TsaE
MSILEKDIYSYSEKQTEDLGHRLGRALQKGDIVLLEGELGSGKTTFVRGIARGVEFDTSQVISPTFQLVRIYPGRLNIAHIDLYRISESDFADLGLEELDEQAALIVEWGEKSRRLKDIATLEIEFEIVDELTRMLKIKGEPRLVMSMSNDTMY